jgi:hypothetical protein
MDMDKCSSSYEYQPTLPQYVNPGIKHHSNNYECATYKDRQQT